MIDIFVRGKSIQCVMACNSHMYVYNKGPDATDICKIMVEREKGSKATGDYKQMAERTPQPLPKWQLKNKDPNKGKLNTMSWSEIDNMQLGKYDHSETLEDARFELVSTKRNPKTNVAGRQRDIMCSAAWMAEKSEC